MKNALLKTSFALVLFLISQPFAFGQENISKQLKGFDQYMQQALKDWNTPGVGVGIVMNGKLVFAKGYGYRDYGKKLPVTANTMFQIASNTKLFTTVATGFLVEEGKLDWDKPIRNYVPSIQFYNDELNSTVTMHDMLSHRTGVSRHDLIWYKSDFSRPELFSKLKYLEPSQPLRQGFLYNNLMYAAAGQIIELLSQKTWEAYLQEKILDPLDMKSTFFSTEDMMKQPDYGIPYNEKRDGTSLYPIPIYSETGGMGPAGSISSNINDLSHWLIALMNDGKYNGKQVLPAATLKASLEPSTPKTNFSLAKGYTEIVNPIYGVGRDMSSYRGHFLTLHGGALPGFYSQISFMPKDNIGVIVFVLGDQSVSLENVITYNIYERMLGLSQTPWGERRLNEISAGKAIAKEARGKATVGKVMGTKPSHPLDAYPGEYENPAYGSIFITKKDDAFQFALHNIKMPLTHFHYDRFDTPNDEADGLFSVNFTTNPQGDISGLSISLDEGEAKFTRKADASLSKPEVLAAYTGKYQMGGSIFEIVVKNGNTLFAVFPGAPLVELIPYKPQLFQTREFADFTIEFMMEDGKVNGMKQKDPSGEYLAKKI
jgi:CubicO group peptidase (beta-lactamase class C family)